MHLKDSSVVYPTEVKPDFTATEMTGPTHHRVLGHGAPMHRFQPRFVPCPRSHPPQTLAQTRLGSTDTPISPCPTTKGVCSRGERRVDTRCLMTTRRCIPGDSVRGISRTSLARHMFPSSTEPAGRAAARKHWGRRSPCGVDGVCGACLRRGCRGTLPPPLCPMPHFFDYTAVVDTLTEWHFVKLDNNC